MEKKFRTAFMKFENGDLQISTGKITRVWNWTSVGFATTKIVNEEGNSVYEKTPDCADWKLEGIPQDAKVELQYVTSEIIEDRYTSSRLEVVALMLYPEQHISVKMMVWAYPGAPGLRVQMGIKAVDGYQSIDETIGEDVTCADTLPLPQQYKQIKAIGYYNDTQRRNEEDTPILREEIIGTGGKADALKPDTEWASALTIEEAEGGICVVKESHKCANQKGYDTGDFVIKDGVLKVTGLGLKACDTSRGNYRFGWATWCVVYSGNLDNLEMALKVFDRLRYPIDSERDIYIMSNTWGSTEGAAAARNAASEESALQEIQLAAEIGVDVVQIDDGWQNDMDYTMSDAKGGWYPHKGKYPEGWKHVRQLAQDKGVKLGLWHAWVATADEMLFNCREGEFKYLKLDFAVLDTYEKLERLMNNVKRVISESDYKVRVNWDVTENPPRIGYFYGREYGNIYLENRKPRKPETTVYKPHLVLRDAWEIAKYLNVNKFQVTMQNKDMINDQVSNAKDHTWEYCLMIALMGSPILFQELKYLSDEGKGCIAKLIATYKAHREAMYQGYTFAIGEVPNGSHWSGFQCHNPENQDGYLTIFRELGNFEDHKQLQLKFLKGKVVTFEDILTGEIFSREVDEQGRVHFEIQKSGDFRYLKYSL